MTRQQYEAKYGALPAEQPQERSLAPIKMTQAQYDAKYGKKPLPGYQNLSKNISDFSTGVAKGGLETLQNVGSLITNPLGKAMGVEFGFKPEAFQAQNKAENIGKTTERIAEYVAPIGKVGALTKGRALLNPLFRSATAGGVATAQEGKLGKETLIAAGTEMIGGPVLKLLSKPITKLIRSTASGLSGVSGDVISAIKKSPYASWDAARTVSKGGQAEVVKKLAGQVTSGISSIRKQARAAYGKSLEKLKITDVNPEAFRKTLQPMFDTFGINKNRAGRILLENVEFSDPVNIKKALKLIDKIDSTELDGYSLRRLMNDLDDAAYSIARSDERAAFNAFVRDLSTGVRTAINSSTKKMGAMNKRFAQDMQLAEAAEGIFGKVKFGSLNEMRRVANSIENLFSKAGFSPEIIDDFLTRAGLDPAKFRAEQATRLISNVGPVKNTEGISVYEIIRGLTSAVISPTMIRNAAIATGIAEDVLKPVLESMPIAARGAFIRSMIDRDKPVQRSLLE